MSNLIIMSSLVIKTNKHRYPIIYWHELTNKERKDFDYLETEEEQAQASFVRYRKTVYLLSDFMHINHEVFKGWSGHHSDSFFSGILIKLAEDGEDCVMGTYYS